MKMDENNVNFKEFQNSLNLDKDSIEKRNQNIRDDILEMNHMNPSYTRQAKGEWERQQRDHNLATQKAQKTD